MAGREKRSFYKAAGAEGGGAGRELFFQPARKGSAFSQ